MSLQIYRPQNTIDKNILKNHINNTIVTKLSGKNTSTDIFLYTNNQDPWTRVFERDPNCWLNGVSNIGCWCAAQLDGSQPWSGKQVTLISPRHVYFSQHNSPCGYNISYGGYQCPPDPVPVLFVNGSNQVISRKIVKYALAGDHWYLGPNSLEEVVGLLDEDVPSSSFPFAKVFPPSFHNYFNFTKSSNSFPNLLSSADQFYSVSFTWNQSNWPNPGNELYKAQTVMLCKVTNTNFYIHYPSPGQSIPFQPEGLIDLRSDTPTAAAQGDSLSAWFSPIGAKLGDSGRPIFIIIDNELVLLSIWLTASSGKAISHLEYYNSLNRAMQKLGGGYYLTPIDLEYVYNKYKT